MERIVELGVFIGPFVDAGLIVLIVIVRRHWPVIILALRAFQKRMAGDD